VSFRPRSTLGGSRQPALELHTDRTQVVIAGGAVVNNLRRGYDELGVYYSPALRVAASFTAPGLAF